MKLWKRRKPLLPVNMKRATGLDETVDEMLIVMAKETNYTMADMLKMDLIRFLRIVENVKKMVKTRNGGEADDAQSEPVSRLRRKK